MRVQCTKLIEIAGPNRGQALHEHPQIAIGATFTVLSLEVDPTAPDPWKFSIQVKGRARRSPTWWPAEMFNTIDTRIPSNWSIELGSEGSLRICPEPWRRPGFWSEFFDRHQAAVATFDSELAIIISES